jgi:hypothetical protein
MESVVVSSSEIIVFMIFWRDTWQIACEVLFELVFADTVSEPFTADIRIIFQEK